MSQELFEEFNVKNIVLGVGLLLILSACNPNSTANAAEDSTADAAAASADAPGSTGLGTDHQKVSYTAGRAVAENIKQQFGDVLDNAAFQLGVADAISGKAPQVSDEQAEAAMKAVAAAKQAESEKVGEVNLSAGAAFLAENGQKEGIKTLDSGLQYEVINAGDGPKPAATDQVTTHYEGRLIDGTVFDSSVARGEPATFPLNRVIPGWTEALQLMPVGAKWRLFIPSNLAYGSQDTGSIPPNSTLIFEVELLEIVGGDKSADT